jgi:hypothetical protein
MAAVDCTHPIGLRALLRRWRRALPLLALLMLAGECEHVEEPPTNFVVTSETCPLCTNAMNERWERAVAESLGVVGVDPAGSPPGFIGDGIAEGEWFENRNWYPVSGNKETLCGRYHHLGFAEDGDWNHYIMPNPPFRYLIDDLVRRDPDRDVHDCDGTDDCMEAELAPDKTFVQNPWFNSDDRVSSLEGQDVCAYGPWVTDEGHDWRPEIHPSELMWWTEGSGATRTHWLMLLQDNSERFDDLDNFEFDDPRPDGWRPWADNPRAGLFGIAFEADVTGPPLDFYVFDFPGAKRNVVTSADPVASRDADEGRTHAFEYDGRVLATVHEFTGEDDDIGVDFFDYCRDAGNTRVRGFLSLRSVVGVTDDADGEGYHVIAVAVRRGGAPAPKVAPPPMPRVALSIETLEGTVAGGAEPLVDMAVELTKGPDGEALDSKVRDVRLRTDDGTRPLAFVQMDDGLVMVQQAPVFTGGTLEVEMESGYTASTPYSGVSLTVLSRSVEMLGTPRDATKVDLGRSSLVAPVVRATDGLAPVAGWDLSVAPAYAPRVGSELKPEDESGAALALNEIVAGRGAVPRSWRQAGDDVVDVGWDVKAVDVTTGNEIPVALGDDPLAEVAARPESSDLAGDTIVVTFPKPRAEAVYRVEATATVRDGYGHEASVSQVVWSHVVEGGPARALQRSVLGDMGLRGAEVAGGRTVVPMGPDSPALVSVRDRLEREAAILASQAASDGVVTIDEHAELERLARLLEGN